MKCLVTGSEGFIGKNLVARLQQDGHEVQGWDIKMNDVYDVRDAVPDLRLENCDVFFHLACVNQMQATLQPEDNLEVNALATRELANYAAKIGAKFIYTSTASVYGNADVIPTPVTAETRPLTDYAIAKLAGEHFVRNSGCNYTILRLSNVYGPHQTPENPYCGVIGRFISQALNDQPLTIIGNGSQTRDWCYVDDVVTAIIFEGENRSWGTQNISTGYDDSVEKVAGIVARAVGGTHRFEWIGNRPIDSIQRRAIDSTRFRCKTQLKEGIEKTVEWYRKEVL